MKWCFGIFLIGLITLNFVDNSIGSVSIEEAIQKRVEMFKTSGKNIKKLNKHIRAGDINDAIQLIDFHVMWSEKMHLLFPIGSEASISNGSDASLDIWTVPAEFKNSVRRYNISSKTLKESLQKEDFLSINKNFEDLVSTCKGCHKQFRN